ncbi:unnamed protein product [Mytilus edulis]|uniref:Ig-like domain-containing protein n=1 Tax=Mytilus edulis TaxID=6550 RepID=A0A8S3PTR4_MYTED|nr:unnamed protein product [Mytilus edulis]
MVSALKYVMFQFLSWHIYACTDLELLTKPVVFGENVRLACAANDTEIPLDQHPSRSWSGGPLNKVLCKNAISADLSKYYEVIGKDRYEYILIIKNFSEADVGCVYKCIVGVDETRKTLQLNEEDYEYIPPKETTTVTSNLQYGHFSVDVHIDKVWPTPECEIMFQDIKYGNKANMSKRTNGKLYSVDISLKHTLRKEDCTGEMLISCEIGTKHIEVQRKHFNTCPVTAVPRRDKNFLNDYGLITLVIAVFMILVLVFVIMISIIIKQKGYIKSIFNLYLGYLPKITIEIPPNKEPFLKETQEQSS